MITQQQQQAIDARESCVVSAGAGSGKTRVLSHRFLRLVKSGTPCNRILTITFTRKAAAEMKSRIAGLMYEAGLADQLEIFHSAKICTVDSFCQEIVRSDCRRYGIPGNFRIPDALESASMIRQLASDLLTQSAESPAGKYLLSIADPSAVISLLSRLAGKMNIVHPYFGPGSAQPLIDLAVETANSLESKIIDQAIAFISEYACEDKLRDDIELMEKCLTDFNNGNPLSFVRAIFTRRCPGQGGQRKIVKEDASLYCLCVNTLENRENIEGVYDLIGRFEQRINEWKRSAGILSFSDCMQMAIDILLKNRNIRTYWKNAFSYVMIDEFQDNNDDYRKLLYLLCEKEDVFTQGIPEAQDLVPEKIFLVGDEKQSIYRFRGADVSVFKRMQSEICASGGRTLGLDYNFRSNAPLLELFNTVFAPLMSDSSRDFQARFSPLLPGLDTGLPSRVILNALVHPHRDSDSEGMAGYVESEASSLADMIGEMTKTDGFLIKDGDSVRRPGYSDIAVLLRSYSDQASYEKALRLRGIPYVLTRQKDLMREAVAGDFYSLMNLVLHRNDALCRESVKNGPFGSFVTDEVLDRISDIVAKEGIAAAVDYAWFDMGYRNFVIANPANQPYTEHYLNIYSIAADLDLQGRSFLDFLQYLREADEEDDRAVISDRAEGVRIMSIHSSKGLEFPIVILADMGKKPGGDHDSIKVLFDGDNPHISCSTDAGGRISNLYNLINGDIDKQMETAELIRLFYVAATRAIQHLVFSGAISSSSYERGKFATGPSECNTLMGLLCCATGMWTDKSNHSLNGIPAWLEYRQFSRIPVESTYSSVRMSITALERNRLWYEDAAADSFDWSDDTLAVTAIGAENAEERRRGKILKSLDSDAFLQEKGLQKEFGTYVHSLIEDRIKGTQSRHELPAELTDTQRRTFANDASALADNFINSSFWTELSSGGYQLWSERRFEMYDKQRQKLLNGAIDLLAVGKDSFFVIDFKTDIVKDVEEHRIQLQTYADAVSSVYPGRKPNAVVFYLRCPDEVLYLDTQRSL